MPSLDEDRAVSNAVRWPWSKPAAALPIPPYQPPITRTHSQEREDEGIEVEEVDTSAMTRTGVYRAWDRLTGRFKGDN